MCAALSSHPLQDAGATGTPGQLMEVSSSNILGFPGLQPILIQGRMINLNLDKPTLLGFVILLLLLSGVCLGIKVLKGKNRGQVGKEGRKIVYMEWGKREALKPSSIIKTQ